MGYGRRNKEEEMKETINDDNNEKGSMKKRKGTYKIYS